MQTLFMITLKIIPTIESMKTRDDPDFIKTLLAIYEELPKPLQVAKENFEEIN